MTNDISKNSKILSRISYVYNNTLGKLNLTFKPFMKAFNYPN